MTPIEQYVAPAGARPGWWRPVFGLAMILGFWVVGAIAVMLGWALFQMGLGEDPAASLAALMDPTVSQGPMLTLLMLGTFVGIWLGCWLAAEALHAQPFATMFAPEARVRWREFMVGVGIACGMAAISIPIAIAIVGVPVHAQPVADWAVWLAPLLVLVFLQATGEELIFRGYLLQQLRLRARSPLVWAALPSLTFGVFHFFNVEDTVQGLYYVAITFVAGLTFAAMVWRTGALWMAIGMHLGNNLLTLTLVGAEGLMSGTQLWLFPGGSLASLLPLDLLMSLALLGFVLSPWGRVLAPASAEG